MSLDTIKKEWVNKVSDVSASAIKWDVASEVYASRPLPTPEDDSFLKLLFEECGNIHGDMLDVGCGIGRYSLALANNVDSAIGVDLSPGMIKHACSLKEKLNAHNMEFRVCDWNNVEDDDPILKKKFDLTIAHMTPALGSAIALERMLSVSKGMCFISKPTRRKDQTRTKVREIVGMGPEDDTDAIPNILSMLWYMGFEPHIHYEPQIWYNDRNMETAIGYYLNDVKTMTDINSDAEKEILEYLEKISKDGVVKETVHVLKTTIFWNMETHKYL